MLLKFILFMFILNCVLALPASDDGAASSNSIVTKHVHNVSNDLETRAFEHGTCSFHVTVQHGCGLFASSSRPSVQLSIPYIRDAAGNTVMEPNRGFRNTPESEEYVIKSKEAGLDHDITAFYAFVYDSMVFSYGPHNTWYSEDGTGKGLNECKVGAWTRPELDCKKDRFTKRFQDMDCFFGC